MLAARLGCVCLICCLYFCYSCQIAMQSYTIVAQFKTIGLVNNQPTPDRQRNARSTKNIATVPESVQEIPKQSIFHLAYELSLTQTSTWRIYRGDLVLHLFKNQLSQLWLSLAEVT